MDKSKLTVDGRLAHLEREVIILKEKNHIVHSLCKELKTELTEQIRSNLVNPTNKHK